MSNMKDFVIKFNEASSFWESSQDMNLFYVRSAIVNLCTMLRARGYLFAREVYERFGIPFTKESIIAGWHEPDYIPTFNVEKGEDNGSFVITFSAREDIRDYF